MLLDLSRGTMRVSGLLAGADRLRSGSFNLSGWGLQSLQRVVLLAASVTTGPAFAVPSFAIQTGQPCAACHIGAFGPQLTPYGRDFKLHGYVASDGRDHGLPLALTTQSSFTHTLQSQPGGAAPGFRDNDNFAFDQASLYWAGRLTPEIGGFIELNYDGGWEYKLTRLLSLFTMLGIVAYSWCVMRRGRARPTLPSRAR